MTFIFDISVRGQHVGRTRLVAGRDVGPKPIGTHLWAAIEGESLFAASADARWPAMLVDKAIPTTLTRLPDACSIRVGEAQIAIRRESGDDGMTRVHALDLASVRRAKLARESATAPSRRPRSPGVERHPGSPRISRPVRVLACALSMLIVAILALPRISSARTAPPPPPQVGAAAPAAPAAPPSVGSASAPGPASAPPSASAVPAPKPPPLGAATAAAPTRDGRDPAGERRVAQAILAGDYVRALAEAEVLAHSHPKDNQYKNTVRVLRAKVRR